VADEKKRQAALSLKKDTTRTVGEICEILGISRNTYYKYTRPEAPAPPDQTETPDRPSSTPKHSPPAPGENRPEEG